MKIYFNKKDKIIDKQKRIIEQLESENKFLEEQLKIYNTDNLKEKYYLIDSVYEQYMGLIKELNDIKQKYLALCADKKKNKISHKLAIAIDKLLNRNGEAHG